MTPPISDFAHSTSNSFLPTFRSVHFQCLQPCGPNSNRVQNTRTCQFRWFHQFHPWKLLNIAGWILPVPAAIIPDPRSMMPAVAPGFPRQLADGNCELWPLTYALGQRLAAASMPVRTAYHVSWCSVEGADRVPHLQGFSAKDRLQCRQCSEKPTKRARNAWSTILLGCLIESVDLQLSRICPATSKPMLLPKHFLEQGCPLAACTQGIPVRTSKIKSTIQSYTIFIVSRKKQWNHWHNEIDLTAFSFQVTSAGPLWPLWLEMLSSQLLPLPPAPSSTASQLSRDRGVSEPDRWSPTLSLVASKHKEIGWLGWMDEWMNGQ